MRSLRHASTGAMTRLRLRPTVFLPICALAACSSSSGAPSTLDASSVVQHDGGGGTPHAEGGHADAGHDAAGHPDAVASHDAGSVRDAADSGEHLDAGDHDAVAVGPKEAGTFAFQGTFGGQPYNVPSLTYKYIVQAGGGPVYFSFVGAGLPDPLMDLFSFHVFAPASGSSVVPCTADSGTGGQGTVPIAGGDLENSTAFYNSAGCLSVTIDPVNALATGGTITGTIDMMVMEPEAAAPNATLTGTFTATSAGPVSMDAGP